MKKYLLFFAILLVTFLVFVASADENAQEYTSGYYKYIVGQDGNAVITAYTGWDANLVLPSQIDGYPITSIGDHAFKNRDTLNEITLPHSVVTVGANPFIGCTNLLRIRVPSDHKTLATINGVLFDKTEKELICYPCAFMYDKYEIPPGICAVGEYAFYENEFLKGIILPDSIECIKDTAFGWCAYIDAFSIPDSVEYIGDSAFCGCKSLIEIVIPDSVTYIGEKVFSNCYNLKTVTLSNAFDAVPNSAFYDCWALESVVMGNNILSINDFAFYGCDDLRKFDIPESVIYIGDGSFEKCVSLTEIVIPASVIDMGANPYRGCIRLKDIRVAYQHPVFEVVEGVLLNKLTNELICYPCSFEAEAYAVPQGIQRIGSYAFYECKALESLALPDTVALIGFSSFYGCKSLIDINIPDSIISISDFAFYGCRDLFDVMIPETVIDIGEDAFSYCDSLFLTVHPDSCAEKYAIENRIPYTLNESADWLNGW